MDIRKTTWILAIVNILVGSSVFLLSSEPASLVALCVGIVQLLLSLQMKANRLWPVIAALGISGIVMLLAAQSVPKFIHIMAGKHLPASASILALSILAVTCLIHLTIGIRWVRVNQRYEKRYNNGFE